MIVAMNYNTDGTRYIARIEYDNRKMAKAKTTIAQLMKTEYDEVYVVNLDNSNVDFINSIVLGGCRI